ncbi:hypothetical protein BDF19DRAFT_415604 [Syncephalis fuscata]|nr:hypothetical protein BDF19DRAFT_415604 [Syncephalis fuscata]
MVTYFILEYVIQVKSRAGFNVAHMIVFHKRQPGDFGKFFGDNSGIEYDYPETKISLQYDAGLISRDVFRQLLNDPDRVDSFKKYTVRDLSVENILFYEACQAILTTVSSPRDGPAHSTEHSTLQRRVAMLHSTFLETDSDLEVNLTEATLHRLSSYLDSSASYGDFKAYCALMDAVRAAQEEILELMFFDTYPRYLNSASRHTIMLNIQQIHKSLLLLYKLLPVRKSNQHFLFT